MGSPSVHRRGAITTLAVIALCLGSASWFGARPARAACGASTTLQDGGFETPVVAANTYTLFPAASVPPWQTTDSLAQIEIWGTGYLGVPAASGNAFGEINANSPATIYQDVASQPGDTWTWTLAHRGRAGNDTMRVLIGDAAAADLASDSGWNYLSPGLMDGNAAWGTHSDTYVVPPGQTCTRLAFRAVSAASGSPSIGNFLDDVSLAIAPAATPTPTPTATPTPTPSPTPTPTPTTEPTPTITPTATPTGTLEPTPAPTAEPTPTPTGTPAPTSTTEATSDPGGTTITPPPTDTAPAIDRAAPVQVGPIVMLLLIGTGLVLAGLRFRPGRR